MEYDAHRLGDESAEANVRRPGEKESANGGVQHQHFKK
jgi:hypothetical protein